MRPFPAPLLLSALFVRQRQAFLQLHLPHLHNLFFHQKSITLIKFANGKAVWEKCSTGSGLVTLEGHTSASTGTPEVPMPPPNAPPSTKMTASTYVPSVAVRVTTPSLGHAVPRPLEEILSVSPPPCLMYTNFSHSVFPRLPLSSSTALHTSIFECILHPYNPNAFKSLLLKHSLSPHYPLLPFNLQHGFPLGHMPALTNGVVLPNNPSAHAYMSDIQEYLQKELLAGRMLGPFSWKETELILHMPFQSSPLIISLQPQQCDMPDKVRICRHLSKASKLHASINSHICKEDFPTHFNLASKVAEIVSVISFTLFPHFLGFYYMTPLCFVCGVVFFFSVHPL